MNIQPYLKEYDLYKDNPIELSDLGIKLAAEIFFHSTRVAESELNEKAHIVSLLTPDGDFKKMSVAESEVRAVMLTDNEYGKNKINLEAAYEILNMLKMRIKTLITERDSQKGAL